MNKLFLTILFACVIQAMAFAQNNYVIQYKGFHCINNKAKKNGTDLKIYFLAISEDKTPNDILALRIDSMGSEGIKKGNTYPGPVVTIYKGANTEGVSLLCKMVEDKTKLFNTINNWGEAFKEINLIYHGETVKKPTSGAMPNASTDSSEVVTKNQPNKKVEWNGVGKVDAIFNPFKMLSILIQKKNTAIEKKCVLIKATDYQNYLSTPVKEAYGIEHHFSMVLENNDSVYEVFFEIVPTKSSVIKAANE